MEWVQVSKHNHTDEEHEIYGFSLIKWEEKGNPNFWVLYRTKATLTREDRLLEIPRETSTERAKEMAMNFMIDKLSNQELRELYKET
jgi:hypothetical protein